MYGKVLRGTLLILSVLVLLNYRPHGVKAQKSEAGSRVLRARERFVPRAAPQNQYRRLRQEPVPDFIDDDDLAEILKRQSDDYGHMRFGKREFDDYGHMRFGRDKSD